MPRYAGRNGGYMAFSEFLDSRRARCRALCDELSKSFAYVGILGSDVKSSAVRVNKSISDISEGSLSECGFTLGIDESRFDFKYTDDCFKAEKYTK